jgi:hypothetical protein
MKEQIINKLIEYLQQSRDFALEQIPDVILQTLRYKIISSYIESVLMIVLIIASIIVSYYFWKHPKLDKYGDKTGASYFGTFMPLVLVLIFFADMCSTVDVIIKIYIAPKFYLLELLMSKLAKGE